MNVATHSDAHAASRRGAGRAAEQKNSGPAPGQETDTSVGRQSVCETSGSAPHLFRGTLESLSRFVAALPSGSSVDLGGLTVRSAVRCCLTLWDPDSKRLPSAGGAHELIRCGKASNVAECSWLCTSPDCPRGRAHPGRALGYCGSCLCAPDTHREVVLGACYDRA
jgi:hypothetical protein